MGKRNTLTRNDEPHCIYPYNAQNLGSREEQQDYFSFSDMFNKEETSLIGSVAVLADGMGGLQNGSSASHAAVNTFINVFRNSVYEIPDIAERLYFAVQKANEAVKAVGNAGSTLCAAAIKDWKLYWVSVGDSRIYLYRHQTLRQLNTEHNLKTALRYMEKNGATADIVIPNDKQHGDMLTSYLGIPKLEEIDINHDEFPLFLGDSVMICSDGLYRAVSDEEMAHILTNSDENVCENLIDAALRKCDINQDNITVMLMDID